MGRRLVRDDALKTWQVPGAEHQVRPARDHVEHVELLRRKLIEETGEVIFATTRNELIKELADVWTVLAALAHVHDIEPADIQTVVEQRRAESGGFELGMVWETGR